jgi:hypothetical protein
MKWGQITWIFLHTLSMKIQPEQYTGMKDSLYGVLLSICRALPCPECSEHAMLYMKKKTAPETIEKFRLFLWEFHNVVNKNTKKQQLPQNVLSKYNNTDLQKVFDMLQMIWLNQPYNPNLIPKQIVIKQTIQSTRSWLIKHKMII